MKNDTFYFPHDFNARNDKKMIKLRQVHKQAGIGIYWSLVEMLYEESGLLLLNDVPVLASELRAKIDMVDSVIRDFNLFENDGEYFWSNSVKRRMDKRLEKSEKAKASASHRWQNANGMRTHSDSNAIKERKVKERKVNKREINGRVPPNEFYLKEIADNSGHELIEKYRAVVDRFNGKNEAGLIFKNVLSMPHQLSFQQYLKLRQKGKETGQDVFDVLQGMENRKDVCQKNESVYLTANNWINIRTKEKI
jgi:hypothetical protein